ncbi:ROK family transcriptional regulator [Paeniglutamicibacter quisquiliarum]|uniref:ROK family transcriptional regulator n=1 Tax=Paeniglutamicibacter quisquiliarum TaxID=2849498 RepID=UPI0020C23CCB|nr:ROK family transcriptional regulator [Paeniglutamicibacter quisquiliarum]
MSPEAMTSSDSIATRNQPAGQSADRIPLLSEPELEVARAILIHGPSSRGELSQRLNLSAASLTRLSKPLLDAGIVSESELVLNGSVGRPVRLLDIRQEATFFVGIKITGQLAQGVLTDLRAKSRVSATRDLPTREVADVLEVLVELIGDLRERAGQQISGVGISLGGQISDGMAIERAPFLGWRNVPLGDLLHQRTGLPVLVENDVTALVAAEQWFGVGREAANFAVVTIGAGVGYGLAIHRQVVRGRDAGLGLGGHFPLDPNGPLCMEGHRGCSTAMLTIPSICAQISTALLREVGYGEAFALAAAGNKVAHSVLQAAALALGRFLAAAANLTMVNVVVLGGEGIELFSRFEQTVRSALAADRDPEASEVRIAVLSPEFDQWARGAAAVAIQKYAFA